MSVEKEPLTEEEFDRILAAATRKNEEARKLILLLRYTGMHISTLCNPKYKLHVEDKDIIWYRAKKRGKEARVTIRISKNLDYNVKDFIDRITRRKRKNNRQYYYTLIRDIGHRAGIKDLSPMSFRHTFGVSMLDMGFPQAFVQQKLNCSDKTLKTYLKYSSKRANDLFDRLGW